jgi:hypothetical protein
VQRECLHKLVHTATPRSLHQARTYTLHPMISADILTACRKGDLAAVQGILKHHAKDASRKDGSGWSAIHLVAGSGHIDILKTLLDWKPSLLNKHTAASRSTPMYIAAFKGQAGAVEELLRRGAKPDTTDSKGNTPMHAAMYWGHEDIAIILMQNGAAADSRNDAGKTPQEVIVYNRERQLKRYRDELMPYRVGSKVDVNYQSRGNWFTGAITFISFTGCDVKYIDGEEAVDVPMELLRPHGQKLSSMNCGKMNAVESVDNMLLYVGAQVQAKYHGEGSWLAAVISRVRMDGTFDIDFNDSPFNKECKVPKVNVRLPVSVSASASAAALHVPEEVLMELDEKKPDDVGRDFLELGMKVKVNYQESGAWKEGTISAINPELDTYDVAFDDGDFDDGIPMVLIDYLLVGSSVEGRWHGTSTWLPGVLMRVQPGGLYDIDYDNGSCEKQIPRSLVRLYRSKP